MLSHSTEEFRRKTFLCVQKTSGFDRVYAKGGGGGGSITLFCPKIVDSQTGKILKGQLFVFLESSGIENFYG